MSDNFDSLFGDDFYGSDADAFLKSILDGNDSDAEKDDGDLLYDTSTTALSSDTPKKLDTTTTALDEKATTLQDDINESGLSAVSSGYQSLNSVENLEQVDYPENVPSQSPPSDMMMYQAPYNNYYNPQQQMHQNAPYYYNPNQTYLQHPQQQNNYVPSPPITPIDSSKPSSVLVEMLNRDPSPQNVQQSQQHGYPMNNYYYQQAPMPSQMMPRAQMNQPQYYQPSFVYYSNQQNVYHPNAPVQRHPYQSGYVQQRMPVPQGNQPGPMRMQQPLYVQAHPYSQQQQNWGQAFPQVRQIAPKSMPQVFQTSNPEKVKTFELPPTPSKMKISAVADKEESRATRSVEPYKIPIIFKRNSRELTGEAALLEINREKYQRWHNCIEYIKKYLSSSHELIPFVVLLLEQSANSNDLIQWKERTAKLEHDRAFEFKNKDGITKAYFDMTGKETKYNSIVTRLTRLCNLQFDGCPVFRKTKQRSTYEIFPTLIPSHNDQPAPVQIVNGLPVETDDMS